MKRSFLLFLLVVPSLAACTSSPSPAPIEIDGRWIGYYSVTGNRPSYGYSTFVEYSGALDISLSEGGSVGAYRVVGSDYPILWDLSGVVNGETITLVHEEISTGHVENSYHSVEYDYTTTRVVTLAGEWDGYRLSGVYSDISTTDATDDYYDTLAELEGEFTLVRQLPGESNSDDNSIDGHWVGYCEMGDRPDGGDIMALPIDLTISTADSAQLQGQLNCIGCWPAEAAELSGTWDDNGFEFIALLTYSSPENGYTYYDTLTFEGTPGNRELIGSCDSVYDAHAPTNDNGHIESHYAGEFIVLWVP